MKYAGSIRQKILAILIIACCIIPLLQISLHAGRNESKAFPGLFVTMEEEKEAGMTDRSRATSSDLGSRSAPKKNKSTAEKIRNALGWGLVGGTLGAFAFGVGAVVLTAPVTVPLLIGGAIVGGIVGGLGSVIHDSK